ncbi:hypothetical protein MATL_G00050460 [Megalops atlanticus]|uniref:Uncharacterized protein n=1 Tax=Megalops atlanticus TaxID=7932 RepID=A0A9D3QBA6_MEGAT|nr:hypothetical protein MATL_G00050460 [Megalops atlanticus]
MSAFVGALLVLATASQGTATAELGKLFAQFQNKSYYSSNPVQADSIPVLSAPWGDEGILLYGRGHASEYSWTLEHKPLDGSVAYLSDEKDTFILKRNVSGALMCTARNRVCSSPTTVQLSPCPAPVTCRLRNGTEVLICVNITSLFAVLGAVFAILAISVAIYCWSKQNNKSATTDNSDDHELVYAEVMGHRKVKRERMSEVVYGQVKVTQTPDHTEGRTKGQEEELYAKVRK